MNARPSLSVVLAGAITLGGATLGADEMTLTGSVGDAMCGVGHMMDDATACTLGGVAKGAHYALIVDDTAYTLETEGDHDAGGLAVTLKELAGQMATITGDVTGTTIEVASVEAAE